MNKDTLVQIGWALFTLAWLVIAIYVYFFAPCDAITFLPLQSTPARCLSGLVTPR